ncbi:MAG: heme-binding protein [Sphingobacteriales bacterium]|nr:MAG: heme-binding protein [Sphingobacteriales bacterium]
MNVTLEQAHKGILAGLTKASDMDKKMNIAVVDSGANLVAFVRMDDAWLGSADIAIKKAKTAVFFQMDSADLGKLSQPGEMLYGIEVSNGGLISFGGGLILKDKSSGKVIGAVGVSGGIVPEDVKVAQAVVDAILSA